MKTEKLCSKCGDTKPLSMFSKRSDSLDGLQAQCKVCHRSYDKKKDYKAKDRYNKSVCANPSCGKACAKGKMVPHEGELICGGCYSVLMSIQNAAYDMDAHMESLHLHGSGLYLIADEPMNKNELNSVGKENLSRGYIKGRFRG
jgi:hypothetical protein